MALEADLGPRCGSIGTGPVSRGRSGVLRWAVPVVPLAALGSDHGQDCRSGGLFGACPAVNDIAITPDGKTAYVATMLGTVIPVSTGTNRAGNPIRISRVVTPFDHIVIAPNGKTAYVANYETGIVTPISTATNTQSALKALIQSVPPARARAIPARCRRPRPRRHASSRRVQRPARRGWRARCGAWACPGRRRCPGR